MGITDLERDKLREVLAKVEGMKDERIMDYPLEDIALHQTFVNLSGQLSKQKGSRLSKNDAQNWIIENYKRTRRRLIRMSRTRQRHGSASRDEKGVQSSLP